MKDFLDEDFLLNSQTARILYHDYAEKSPIYDFHCHLSCEEIYNDKHYSTITEVWLYGDHYKWRLLREFGVPEEYITGKASDKEKFDKYAELMPYTIGNPIYAWSHLELKRFFGITKTLSPETADEIYSVANQKLKTLSARQMILQSNVKALCTTDDPADDLRFHKLLAEDSFPVKVLPAFRPDKCINIDKPTFIPWLKKLFESTGIEVKDLSDLEKAMAVCLDKFDKLGCVCSDHALDRVPYSACNKSTADKILKEALAGEKISPEQAEQYKTYWLILLAKEYAKRNWVQQYHIGALRNASTRYMEKLGPDTGFDAMEDDNYAPKLAALLDSMEKTDNLPKTVLYCLNPKDNYLLATLKNCFQTNGSGGKIQFGSAWWHLDQKHGMEAQLEILSQTGLLSKFVGMLTDSRSFLSYTRHEYFRRILCDKLGGLIESGQYPYDINLVGKIVEDICYNNAANYFKK